MTLQRQQITQVMASLMLLPTGALAINVEELPPAAKREVVFQKDIWPVFQKHCVKGHGPEKQKSGFRIDVRELALEGGDMGQNIIPGKSAQSPLVHFISGLDEETIMPPKGELLETRCWGSFVLGSIKALTGLMMSAQRWRIGWITGHSGKFNNPIHKKPIWELMISFNKSWKPKA